MKTPENHPPMTVASEKHVSHLQSAMTNILFGKNRVVSLDAMIMPSIVIYLLTRLRDFLLQVRITLLHLATGQPRDVAGI